MFKYFVGYFNNQFNKKEFTVICGCPNEQVAIFILSKYRQNGSRPEIYTYISDVEAMDMKLDT